MSLHDLSPFPWGKAHKDKPMQDVPAKYLLWLWDKEDGLWCDPDRAGVADYIKANFSSLEQESKDTIIIHRP